jgi:signal peptidase I
MNNNRKRDRFSLMRELQDELFLRDGAGWFKVVSGSMYPLIGVNDRVLVKSLDIHELKPGDIVLFRVDDTHIAHRIIRILKRDGKTLFYQKGDANQYAGLLSPESIMGKVIAIEKKGHVSGFESGRIRIINSLLAMKNCFFYRVPLTRNRYEGDTDSMHYIKGHRRFCSLAKKPFSLCNRFIARILLN